METQARYVLVGSFTVLAMAATLFFAVWLGQPRDHKYHLYQITFSHGVNGLSKASPVQYSGIPVGQVQDLQLEPGDPRRVRATIQVYQGTPIKQDTRARLVFTNITGRMSIQLTGGSPQSPPLAADDKNPPLIGADPSPLDALLENGEGLMSNINHLLANANRLLSEDNVQRVGQTLEHLEQSTRALAEQRGDLKQALAQFAELGQQANRALLDISRLARRSDALLQGQGRQALSKADRSLANLDRLSARLDKLLAANQSALSNGLQGFSELGPAINEFRETLVSLRRLSQQLSDNPGGFLLNRQRIQEFKP